MLTARGGAVFACGVALWLVARLLGSPTVHVIAVGMVVLPLAAALSAWRARPDLVIRRGLSEARVPPGRRVRVELEVENRSSSATPYLLIEDRAPAAVGAPARLVVPGIGGRRRHRASYVFVPRGRGRYQLGPVAVDVSDPFAFTRRRTTFDEHDDLVVTPEVEDLTGGAAAGFGPALGASRARTLLRGGDEFYTMRQYREGDDLRRIHWPSVARKGELMIRQDESSRRGTATLLLDTREASVGRTHAPGFERAVSAAASLGVLLARAGFAIRLMTAGAPASAVGEEQLLDALAGVTHDHDRSLGPALSRVRAAAAADATLVVVTAPPPPSELSSLLRTGAAFGPRLAVLIHPVDPATVPGERGARLNARASQARLSLTRAGWECLVLAPADRLSDVWNRTRATIVASSG